MNKAKRCEYCHFYDDGSHGEDQKYATCRRYPPVADPLMTIQDDRVQDPPVFFAQPVVWAQWWCGEFKQEPEAQRAFERGIMSAMGL